METITQLITNIGFPIACCIGLGWYIKYITDKHEKETNQLKNAHNAFCEGVAKDTRTLYASENVIASAARKLLAQKAMIGWTSKGHSNGYVPVFAIGVGAECFTGSIDNTEIPEKIAQVAGYAQ